MIAALIITAYALLAVVATVAIGFVLRLIWKWIGVTLTARYVISPSSARPWPFVVALLIAAALATIGVVWSA